MLYLTQEGNERTDECRVNGIRGIVFLLENMSIHQAIEGKENTDQCGVNETRGIVQINDLDQLNDSFI